jgi:hypothetical protein
MPALGEQRGRLVEQRGLVACEYSSRRLLTSGMR